MSRRTGAKIAKFKDYSHAKYFDYILLGVVVLLVLFGLMMLYSSSAFTASTRLGDPAFYLKRQAVFVLIGAVLCAGIAFIPYNIYKAGANVIYALTFLLNIAVLFVGRSSNGSTRWIRIGFFSFQPSELMKIALIISMAAVITHNRNHFGSFKFDLKCLILIAFSIVPVLSSNLSTAIIIAGIGFIMLFIASKRKARLAVVAGIGMTAVIVATVFGEGYRSDRIKYWLHPEQATSGKGFQVLQGLYAIGSGGFFGKGLGASDTKLGNLPESQNDMIFSVIVEELGTFGAICLILMYVVLLWRIYLIAVNAKDMFGSFLVIGVFVHLSLQMVLNMLVVTKTIPNTGVTLPFISYGGSSMIGILMEIGIVLSVSRQISLENLSLDEEA